MMSYGEFTSLFQEYRINCIVINYVPTWSNADLANNSAVAPNSLPTIGWAFDYNDANTPLAMDAISEYSNYKEQRFMKAMKAKLWPATAPGLYISAISAGYAVQRKTWIRAANSDVPHYGMKLGIYNMTEGRVYKWSYFYKFYCSFRGMW